MSIINLDRTNAKRPPARSVEYFPEQPGEGLLVLQVGNKPTGYKLTETRVGSDWSGRGFKLVKVFGGSDKEAEAYECFVPKDVAEVPICGCKGFLYHFRCKHIDGLRAIIESGQLDCREPETPATPADAIPADPCGYCSGTGGVYDEFSAPGQPERCPVCAGSGIQPTRQVA